MSPPQAQVQAQTGADTDTAVQAQPKHRKGNRCRSRSTCGLRHQCSSGHAQQYEQYPQAQEGAQAEKQQRIQSEVPAGTGGGTGAEASAITGTAARRTQDWAQASVPVASARRHDGAEAQEHQRSRVQQRGGRKTGRRHQCSTGTAVQAGTGAEASAVTDTTAQKAQNYEQCSISVAAARTVRAASASTGGEQEQM